jgi:hypothetical protein
VRRGSAWLALVLVSLALAGCFREDDENTQEGTDTSPGQVVVEVELNDDGISMPDEITAGDVLFEVTNSGTTDHGFSIDGTDAALDSLAVDQLDTVEVSLEPGDYTAFSPVEGDREAGLERRFTVTEAAAGSGAPLFDEAPEPGEQGGAGEDEPGDGD